MKVCMCNHCKVLSKDEMSALLSEHPSIEYYYGIVYRIVEHDDCYDCYVAQIETSPHNPFNHVIVFDKPLLDEDVPPPEV